MSYAAYMRWPNADVSLTIVTNVSRLRAEAGAIERLARWVGQCRELPRCYVVYQPTGETVFTARTQAEGATR